MADSIGKDQLVSRRWGTIADHVYTVLETLEDGDTISMPLTMRGEELEQLVVTRYVYKHKRLTGRVYRTANVDGGLYVQRMK